MTEKHHDFDFSALLIEKAKACGASSAGVADVEALKTSPSHLEEDLVVWPPGGRSVIVLALIHEANRPELDWWDGNKGTPGNRRLIEIGQEISGWLKREYGISARDLPYQPGDGGVFLKDAAVLAGLGVIGENNLLLTPETGPLVRFRGLICETRLAPTGPADLDFCSSCDRPCWTACPQDAFESGSFSRARCRIQMNADESGAGPGVDESSARIVKYCRACEVNCLQCL